MLKKEIKCKDFNGVERIEEAYFNLNKAEIMEMELSTTGGFSETVQSIVKAQDTPKLIQIFKELILKAYGVKSPDGHYFEKSEELSKKFAQTNAYSELFMELATDAEAAAKFINGITPDDIDTSKIDNPLLEELKDKAN